MPRRFVVYAHRLCSRYFSTPFSMTGRVEEACNGESCAKDIERGGSRKGGNASKYQESGENYTIVCNVTTYHIS